MHMQCLISEFSVSLPGKCRCIQVTVVSKLDLKLVHIISSSIGACTMLTALVTSQHSYIRQLCMYINQTKTAIHQFQKNKAQSQKTKVP